MVGLTGMYNGQKTLAGQSFDLNKSAQDAQFTGKYNGTPTMDYTQMMAALTGKYNGKDTYQAQQDAFNNNLATQQLALQKAQFKSEKDWREYSYNHMSATDKAQLDWEKKKYGEEAAWRLYQMKYTGELQKSTAQAQINAYAP